MESFVQIIVLEHYFALELNCRRPERFISAIDLLLAEMKGGRECQIYVPFSPFYSKYGVHCIGHSNTNNVKAVLFRVNNEVDCKKQTSIRDSAFKRKEMKFYLHVK